MGQYGGNVDYWPLNRFFGCIAKLVKHEATQTRLAVAPIDKNESRLVAADTGFASHPESLPGNLDDLERPAVNRGKPNENWVDKNGRCWIRTSDLCRVKATL